MPLLKIPRFPADSEVPRFAVRQTPYRLATRDRRFAGLLGHVGGEV